MNSQLRPRPLVRASARIFGVTTCIAVMAPAIALAQSGSADGQTPAANAAASTAAELPPSAEPTTTAPAATTATATPPNAPELATSSAAPAAPTAAGVAPDAAATSTAAPPAAEASEEPAEDLSDSGIEDSKIKFYGFTDTTFTKTIRPPSMISEQYSTFAVGNVNLYMSAELGSNWRSLTEVRFMYLPHGEVPYGSQFDPNAKRMDATTQDYTDTNRPIRWGGIAIQRAWIEHTFHELLTLRFGHFLTPYGIWNVDHGSPTIIGVRKPYMVGEALLPQSQTGIEAYGSFYVQATQFGYHLTLSNGRGPIDTFMDLDRNKAIGGRLFVRTEGVFGTLAVGVSGYRGHYTDRTKVMVTNADGSFGFIDPPTLEYSELSIASDIKWEFEGLLVQAEAATNQVAYSDARPADPGYSGGPSGFTPDNRRIGYYGLVGYRTPWWNIMPFVGGENLNHGRSGFVRNSAAYWAGINVRPTPRVVLKVQLARVFFPGNPVFNTSLPSFGFFDTQIAWSF